jgi:hypothetical protein
MPKTRRRRLDVPEATRRGKRDARIARNGAGDQQRRTVTSGRDRTAARTTLGGEFPALALSIREVGA